MINKYNNKQNHSPWSVRLRSKIRVNEKDATRSAVEKLRIRKYKSLPIEVAEL